MKIILTKNVQLHAFNKGTYKVRHVDTYLILFTPLLTGLTVEQLQCKTD